MRGVDEDSGDYLGPSRGDLRREALAVLELAHRLVEQPAARLAQLPLSEDLLALAIAAQRITAQIARKRQVGFLAKKLRREDDETLEAIRAAMEHDKADSRRDTAALHRIEAMRDHLIADGDNALTELLDEYPHADRQHLRQLARNAREEKLRNKPPHAFRELFRELRELMQAKPDEA
ncbi:MAG: ribosome biogenesis factor YjgA [Arenimonas sp.]